MHEERRGGLYSPRILRLRLARVGALAASPSPLFLVSIILQNYLALMLNGSDGGSGDVS